MLNRPEAVNRQLAWGCLRLRLRLRLEPLSGVSLDCYPLKLYYMSQYAPDKGAKQGRLGHTGGRAGSGLAQTPVWDRAHAAASPKPQRSCPLLLRLRSELRILFPNSAWVGDA